MICIEIVLPPRASHLILITPRTYIDFIIVYYYSLRQHLSQESGFIFNLRNKRRGLVMCIQTVDYFCWTTLLV
jgi:hypothetical protein